MSWKLSFGNAPRNEKTALGCECCVPPGAFRGSGGSLDALGDRENALTKFVEEKASKTLGLPGGAKAALGPEDDKGRKRLTL